MGDKFEMHNAFSREGPQKVYVQHLLKQQGKIINDLLEQKAYFYVCGDAANMAREVNSVLVKIIAEHRGKTEAKAEEIVKNMRAANQYQVRHIIINPHFDLHFVSIFSNLLLPIGGCLVLNYRYMFKAFCLSQNISTQHGTIVVVVVVLGVEEDEHMCLCR